MTIEEFLNGGKKQGISAQDFAGGGSITQVTTKQSGYVSPGSPESQRPTTAPATTDKGVVATIRDIPSDIVEGAKGIYEAGKAAIKQGAEAIDQGAGTDTKGPAISKPTATAKMTGAVLGGVGNIVGEGFITLAKLFASPNFEKNVAEGITETVKPVLESEPVKAVLDMYEGATPETKAWIDGILGTANGLTNLVGMGAAKSGIQAGGKSITQTAGKVLPKIEEGFRTVTRGGKQVFESVSVPEIGSVTSLFKKAPKTVEEAVAQADDALKAAGAAIPDGNIDLGSINKRLDTLIEQGKTAEARALAEATAPKLTQKEKWANLRPDIKARIQGKPELMREYIDVVNARNLNDQVPTVSEHAGNYARKAAEVMQEKLNTVGSDIGTVREKFASVKAPKSSVSAIEDSFIGQLRKLNLQIGKDGVEQIPGTVRKVGSNSDVKVLDDFYKDFQTVKADPTLKNIIDFRMGLDARVNYAKSAREASSSIDPLARQVRKDVASAGEKIVGPKNTADLKKYSDFMEAYNDITAFTDRKAGGEYLLRQVLSGRGGEARQIIKTIKEYTGIDLLDHATMMQLTNEMLGNQAQKNLFRQEITNAGLDAAKFLGGDPRGAISTLFNKTLDRVLDPEKILMGASK